jgi:hypothetical protein
MLARDWLAEKYKSILKANCHFDVAVVEARSYLSTLTFTVLHLLYYIPPKRFVIRSVLPS